MSVSATIPGGDPAVADPSEPEGKRALWITFWIFPGFFGLFGVVFVVLLRVIPPPRPDADEQYVTNYFATNHTSILIGLGLLCLVFGGSAVANGFITYHMKRMSSGPVFAYVYMGALAIGSLPGMLLIGACWGTAALRPDRDPRIIHMLYDLGLLSFNGQLGCFATAYLAFAVAILVDKNGIFPKWLAYLTIWQLVTEVIATQMWQQTSGAFSWNGSIAFWLAVVVFGVWLNCQGLMLKKATDEHPAGTRPPD